MRRPPAEVSLWGVSDALHLILTCREGGYLCWDIISGEAQGGWEELLVEMIGYEHGSVETDIGNEKNCNHLEMILPDTDQP